MAQLVSACLASRKPGLEPQQCINWACWLTAIIPGLLSWRQETQEFKIIRAGLGYMKPYFRERKREVGKENSSAFEMLKVTLFLFENKRHRGSFAGHALPGPLRFYVYVKPLDLERLLQILLGKSISSWHLFGLFACLWDRTSPCSLQICHSPLAPSFQLLELQVWAP